MPAFARTKDLWTYTSDQGGSIMVRASHGYTLQAGVGGAAWTARPAGTKRLGLKLRAAIVKGNTTAVKRRVVIYDQTAYAAIVPLTTTLVVADATNQQETGTVQSLEGERHRGAALLG